MRALGLDVGGSATRWHRRDTSGSALSGTAAGFSGHLFRPEILAKAQAAIMMIAQETGPVDVLVTGVTGFSTDSADSPRLVAMLQAAFGTHRIVVMSDIELACRAVFAPGQGILVYAGTGSIAAHLPVEGALITAGGKGVLIDDAGGGYWIAVRALRAILRNEDTQIQSGWSTGLGRELAVDLGGTDWAHVRQAFYSRDRGSIGLLALAVKRAALAGDPVALAIFERAGEELAQFAIMLEGRIGHHPIALAGGAASLHPALLASMTQALPGRSLSHVSINAARVAAELTIDPTFLDQTIV